MPQPDDSLSAAEYWSRVRRRFTSHFLEFHEEVALPVPGARASSLPQSSIVGPWAGRLWEARFLSPTLFFPELQAGYTTAVRLMEPAQMPAAWMPWLFAGLRPGVFTRGSAGTDRILTRYRERRGNRKGALTGDAQLDEHWGIYGSDETLTNVFRDPQVHAVLRAWSVLSPDPNHRLPTVSLYGTEATLNLPTDSSAGRVDGVVSAMEGFSRVLDRLEEAHGMPPASRKPVVMDLLHDESGSPFPVPRFECPWCHHPTHPRFSPNVDTEACEKCGRGLYRLR